MAASAEQRLENVVRTLHATGTRPLQQDTDLLKFQVARKLEERPTALQGMAAHGGQQDEADTVGQYGPGNVDGSEATDN